MEEVRLYRRETRPDGTVIDEWTGVDRRRHYRREARPDGTIVEGWTGADRLIQTTLSDFFPVKKSEAPISDEGAGGARLHAPQPEITSSVQAKVCAAEPRNCEATLPRTAHRIVPKTEFVESSNRMSGHDVQSSAVAQSDLPTPSDRSSKRGRPSVFIEESAAETRKSTNSAPAKVARTTEPQPAIPSTIATTGVVAPKTEVAESSNRMSGHDVQPLAAGQPIAPRRQSDSPTPLRERPSVFSEEGASKTRKKRADRTVRDVVKTTPAGVVVKMVKSWQKLTQRIEENSIERQVTGKFEIGPNALVVQVQLRYGDFESEVIVTADFSKDQPYLGNFWIEDGTAYHRRAPPDLDEFRTKAGLPPAITSPKCTSDDEAVQLKWVCAEIVDTMVAHFVDKYGAEKNDMGLGPTDDDVFYWLGAKTAPRRAPRSSQDYRDKHKCYFRWPSIPVRYAYSLI